MKPIATSTLSAILALLLAIALRGADARMQEGISYISLDTFQQAYLNWLDRQPKQPGASKMLTLDMPILDVYLPDGRLMYHGEDSHANASFLKRLNAKPQSSSGEGIGGMKLADWVSMFPQFGGAPSKIKAGAYTLFAVTYPSWDVCREQNEAVELCRRSTGPSRVQVWEVRLH